MQGTEVQDFNNPQKTGQWTCFCVEMFGVFSFFEKLNRISLPFLFAELPKKESATEQPIKKKHPKKKPQNPLTIHDLQGFHGHELCPVTSLWNRALKIPMGSRQEPCNSQPLKYTKPLNTQSKCWKLKTKMNPSERPRVRRLHFPIDSIDFSFGLKLPQRSKKFRSHAICSAESLLKQAMSFFKLTNTHEYLQNTMCCVLTYQPPKVVSNV